MEKELIKSGYRIRRVQENERKERYFVEYGNYVDMGMMGSKIKWVQRGREKGYKTIEKAYEAIDALKAGYPKTDYIEVDKLADSLEIRKQNGKTGIRKNKPKVELINK